jgi:cyanophycin synthetase
LKPNGYAVLNADDQLTEMIMGRVKCKTNLIFQDRLNPLLASHINNGRIAVVCENQGIYIYENNARKF